MERIRTTRFVGLSLFAAVLMVIGAGSAWALHPMYEQNGDCFLMIGEGPQRKVWALNNLTGGGVVGLYDPYDAYGIAASQQWDGAKSVKDLFTFAGTESALSPLTGMAPRRVMTAASTKWYSHTEIPEYTVHRFHGPPNQGPTGRGNHPQGTINWLFGGTDYPCSKIPTDVATMPGYQWIPYGYFYHARDNIVWSCWTYGYRVSSPPAGEGSFNPITWGTPVWPSKIPPGPWDTCCAGNRPGNGFMRGGWVRRIVREKLSGKYRDLKLFSYRVGSGATTPTYVRGIASVLTMITGTIDKNGECCDGCIARVDNEALPGVPSPTLDCAYSSQVDRTYLYRRDYNSLAFELMGPSAGDSIVGKGNDLTCQFVGISSKTASSTYVYLLGLNLINQWLRDANANPDMLLNELTDVAVSDQWWQSGGIVYAYDKTKRKVYQFVRNEKGANGIPNEIDVSTGAAPDKIGADGFGNLYLLKTTYEPASTNFSGSQAYDHPFLTTAAGGIPIYRAKFRQKVYKSVIKRDYYSGTFTEVPGQVLLGTNEFYHDCTPAAPTAAGSWDAWGGKWIWWGDQGQFSPVVNSEIRCELAVINSPTPPRVENASAVADCNGPMLNTDVGFVFSKPDNDGFFPDTNDYYFMVENAPVFDSNGVNINSTAVDRDNDNNKGVYPSSVLGSSMVYYWKVKQTKDRYGSDTSVILIDQEAAGTPGSYFFYFPPSPGEFKIGVKVRYRYYDYNKLPLKALSSDKAQVLSGLLTARGEDADGFSWQTIKVKQTPPIPQTIDPGILMSGRPDAKLGNLFRPQSPDDDGTRYCDVTNPKPPAPGFILSGKNLVPYAPGTYQSSEAWAFKLRDSSYNLSRGINRMADLTTAEPPNPPETIIPNTKSWVDPPLYNWKSLLVRNGEVVIEASYQTTDPVLPLAGLRKLFPVSSQPASYTITVDASRRYTYRTFIAVYENRGGVLIRNWTDVPKVIKISISGSASVCVTDTIGPQFEFPNQNYIPGDPNQPLMSKGVFLKNDVLYGTTGERLSNVDSPPAGYLPPTSLDFVVADNNPFGNEATIVNKGTDPFHGSNSLLGLTVTHAPEKRCASFSHTTATLGTMPPASPLPGETYLTNWYRTGSGSGFKVTQANVSTKSEFDALTGAPTQYNKTFSYRKISIPLSALEHFSRPLPLGPILATPPVQALSPEMEPGYANNLDSYENLRYGVSWLESSGLAIPTPTWDVATIAGNIVIRDNDRPNAFVQVRHEKDPDALLVAPTNINCLPPEWRRYTTEGLTEAHRNGVESWTGTGKLNAGFHTAFLSDALAPVLTRVFPENAPLETDVPVLISPLVTDNIGGAFGVATVTFNLSSGSVKLVDAFPGGQSPMQYIFTKPGEYKVVLVIQDKALGWPSNPRAAHKDQIALPGVNTRRLEAILRVVGFRLDTRILERSRQGR